jgi:hypothetical protein
MKRFILVCLLLFVLCAVVVLAEENTPPSNNEGNNNGESHRPGPPGDEDKKPEHGDKKPEHGGHGGHHGGKEGGHGEEEGGRNDKHHEHRRRHGGISTLLLHVLPLVGSAVVFCLIGIAVGIVIGKRRALKQIRRHNHTHEEEYQLPYVVEAVHPTHSIQYSDYVPHTIETQQIPLIYPQTTGVVPYSSVRPVPQQQQIYHPQVVQQQQQQQQQMSTDVKGA